jgi:FkbH-like protein
MVTCLAIADFTVEHFVGYLANDPGTPAVRPTAAPFGQVVQVLMDEGLDCWRERPDALVVWTQPHAVSGSFSRLLAGERVAAEEVLEEVDAYAEALQRAGRRVACAFVPTWVVPPYLERGSALLELRPGWGVTETLWRMNLRLSERLQGSPAIHLLNAQRWIEEAGRRAFNPKLWYMAKIPFGPEVFQAAVRTIKAGLAGIGGQSRKLIVLDLDDTLWGGIVGEVGWEQVALGGHDPVGEAFVDFQRALRALAARGVLLGIVSKGDETAALEAIRRHPEMVLRPEQFAGWKINWQDKAQNLAELAEELNLGLQSVVFIDDHPAERARVREALPEVLVPEWPDDSMLYRKALMGLGCFEAPTVSQEDRQRTQLYVAERQRTELKHRVGSVEEWLATLGLTATFEALNDANLARATQLLNKTNQMNLTTRRMTETELAAWSRQPDRGFWTIRVADRFGDAGLTGLLSVERDGATARIVDFVLSCRVMGRKVEEAMAAVAVRYAQSAGAGAVVAEYRPTAKNQPCLTFWQQSGFSRDGSATIFCWDTVRDYPFPSQLAVAFSPADESIYRRTS